MSMIRRARTARAVAYCLLVFGAALTGVLALRPPTAPHVLARSGGMAGYSGNPAQGGQSCNRCHSGGSEPTVRLTGPQRVRVGEVHGYTLTVSGGQAIAAGLNVSAEAGDLRALLGAADVKVVSGELTHSSPKAVEEDGLARFRFLWSAPREVPSASGLVRLFGAGNSVDLDGTTRGDRAALAVLEITVESEPITATPMPTPTLPVATPTTAPLLPPYEVVFADLDNPHGLSRAGARDYLVAEGGTGDPNPGAFAPGNGDGRVQRLGPGPQDRRVVVGGLTNAQDPAGGIIGANHAIALQLPGPTWSEPSILVAQSGGPGHVRPDEAARVLRIAADGSVRLLADTLAFERQNNPGGESGPEGIDSNPWRLLYDGERVFVTDAGANDVLTMDPASGELALYAVFAPIGTSQAIPTGIARVGRVTYVALLGSMFPVRPDGQVRRLEDTNGDGDALDPGENALLIDGLAMPTDLAIGPFGHLYVLEMFPGSLAVVDPRCWTLGQACDPSARRIVAEGLFAATAFTWDDNYDALVTCGPASPGGPSVRTDRIVRVPYAQLRPGEPQRPVLYLPLASRDAPAAWADVLGFASRMRK